MSFVDEATGLLASITRLKSRLSDLIEPNFGLLDELLSKNVLTQRQFDDVRCETEGRAVYRRNGAILELLTSEDQCDMFVKALQRTEQQHVVNFITQNGGQRHYGVVRYQSIVTTGKQQAF